MADEKTEVRRRLARFVVVAIPIFEEPPVREIHGSCIESEDIDHKRFWSLITSHDVNATVWKMRNTLHKYQDRSQKRLLELGMYLVTSKAEHER